MNAFIVVFFFTVPSAQGPALRVADGTAYVLASSVDVCNDHAKKMKGQRLVGRSVPNGWKLEHICTPAALPQPT